MIDLARYITNTDGNVFALTNLSPEVKAVLFAYYSRSNKSLKETLREVIETTGAHGEIQDSLTEFEEKAAKFHEKWVVGYGHLSIAEHAVVNLGIENISILATKTLEDNRLASYTEKSTRYVEFDRDSYFKVSEFEGTPFSSRYHDLCGELLGTYADYIAYLREILTERIPREGKSEKIHATKVNSAACDIARYLLPVSTLTNVGITANARSIANMVRKMKSHDLSEVKILGADIQLEASKICPTLIKYADANDFLMAKNAIVKKYALGFSDDNHKSSYNYFDIDPEDIVGVIVAGMLYEQEYISIDHISRIPLEMLDEIMAKRGEHDALPREFELIPCSSEITVDYGAFRDIQRHRMCTQINEIFNPSGGYEYPIGLSQNDLIPNYDNLMNKARDLYNDIVEYDRDLLPFASYCLPMAFNKRTLLRWNLREVGHFIELRSGPRGHASYRKVAQDMWVELNQQCPDIMKYIRVNFE